MPRPTAVILIVGLTEELLPHAPRLRSFAGTRRVARLAPVLPAVTCSVQSSMLTGVMPRAHGIVGNGWYNREMAEVQFWKQSNHLVTAEKVWETARRRDASVTCGQMFWWYNMYTSTEYSVTPRPIYKADGRKLPDVYSHPAELRETLQGELGTFPLFRFWGPAASIASTAWIAQAAERVARADQPTLLLVYLPHLDYGLQKYGPQAGEMPGEIAAVDETAGRLIESLERQGYECLVVSEYGIEPVDRPVHINRVLREAGLLSVRVEQGLELLDAGASRAFAVADHQVAHVYVADPGDLARVVDLCRGQPGVARVLDRDGQATCGLDHPRSGELVLEAAPGAWFTYYYWLDDARAPDFARTVDIHRKPGYDPCELFLDPRLRLPHLAIGWRLLKKKLGQRTLLDVIPLDAGLVRGSHGRVDNPPARQPLLIGPAQLVRHEELPCTAVRDLLLTSLFGD